MIKKNLKTTIVLSCVLAILTILLSACKDSRDKPLKSGSEGVYKTINMPESPVSDENEKKDRNGKQQTLSEQAVSFDHKADSYNAKDRVDPFISLIKEKKTEPLTASAVKKPSPVKILSPLEEMELNQLRLTAIVTIKNRFIAMVEDSTGKGYEIKVGTYIGPNKGRVSGINSKSIKVTEHIKDYNGNIKERIVEKKLYQYDE